MPIPKKIKDILDDLFRRLGFIPHLERFLLFYPVLLEKMFDLKQHLLRGDRMERKNAFFIAFIASAEMGSTYMMTRSYWEFKRAGGDNSWIS